MPTYIGFLRAINLGAKRKFAKADIVAATQAAGGREVETYINTGNIRLTSRLRSVQRVAEVLEAAYAERAGFEVTTVVLKPAELREIAADAERFGAGAGAAYVSLLKDEPSASAVRTALERAAAIAAPGERLEVNGRGAHLIIDEPDRYHEAKLANSFVEKHLGLATSRNLRVIRTLVEKWC